MVYMETKGMNSIWWKKKCIYSKNVLQILWLLQVGAKIDAICEEKLSIPPNLLETYKKIKIIMRYVNLVRGSKYKWTTFGLSKCSSILKYLNI